MTVPRSDTKARMTAAALDLLRRHGATAVTVDAVLAASGAPRGSVYHHFPGGRDEILLDAARQGADFLTGVLDAAVAAGATPVQMLDDFIASWAANLRRSDFRAGCPVVALAVDARDDLPDADRLVGDTFDAWQACIARVLIADGFATREAEGTALAAVAAVEGAVMLCRVERSTDPLEQVGRLLRSAFTRRA